MFGPNGAGKSTMMRVITGMIGRHSGSRTGPPPRQVAYLPDRPYLYDWLTVRRCVELMDARHPDFEPHKAHEMLEELGLDTGATVGSCSKGMSEQVHVALTLSRSPALYVLDEPLASVDPLTRARLLDMIRRYRAPDAPMLISTHLLQGVGALFDDVLVIDSGHVVDDTTVADFTDDGAVGIEDAYVRRAAAR